jgi:MFS family permease
VDGHSSLAVGEYLSRQRAAIAVATATNFGAGELMGTAMAVVVGRRGTPLAVGLVLTAYFFGKMVFSPVWGAVADVTGRRHGVLLGTSTLAFLSVLPLAVVDGVWLPIGFRGLYAVFAAGFLPLMLTIVSARGGVGGRGRSVGFFNSTAAVGTTVAQVAAGALLGLLVPGDLFLVIAGVVLVTVAAVGFVDDPTAPEEPEPSTDDVLPEIRRRLLPLAGDREHLRINGLPWLYVGVALRGATVLGVLSLMPIYLVESIGVSEFAMGVLLAINPAGQTVLMYSFGVTADRFGRKSLIASGMAGSGAFAVAAAAPATFGGERLRIAIVAGAFLVLAFTFSAMQTGAIAFVGDVAPGDRESELMGLLSTAKGLGGIVGPVLLGAVATVTSYAVAFVAGSLLAVAGAVLVAFGLVEPERGVDRSYVEPGRHAS